MGSIKEICDAYKLVYSSAGRIERVEAVSIAQKGHVSDPAQGIAAWHGDDGTKIPAEAVQQINDVRTSLRDLDPGLPEGKYTKPTFIAKYCKGRNLYFRESGNKAFFKTLGAEIDEEVKAARAAHAVATEPNDKAQKHKEILQTLAFKHLMMGREGPTGAVNTYDPAIITWGMGYAISGMLGRALSDVYRVENRDKPNADEHYIQKLLYLAGFFYDRGVYHVADTENGVVRTTDAAGINATLTRDKANPPDNPALRLIHDTHELHVAWALLGRDDLTRRTLMRAQLDTFKSTTGDVPQADKIQTGALYTFIAHLQHWTGGRFDVVAWATGPRAQPARVTEPLPSEKGDAALAIQAVHLFYSQRSPDVGKNVFTQPREYWKQMVKEDAVEEGLTAFNPVYDIMTNGPVTTVPEGHLKAVTDAQGTTYDLGPLTDFGRAPLPPPELTPEEKESQRRMYLPNLVDLEAAAKERYDEQERQREEEEAKRAREAEERSSIGKWLRRLL